VSSATSPPTTASRWRHLAVAAPVVVVVSVLLASILSGTAALSAAEAGTAIASLGVVADLVEVRPDAAATFAPAVDGRGLDVGNEIRTDTTGAARVDYVDGSLARLDAGTELRIVDLAGSALAPQVRVRLDVGRVWNRVRHVSGSVGRYEVETSVGLAAVRGTAFTVHCPVRTVCTFTVHEGVIVVTTPDGREIRIEAGESVTLGAPGTDLDGLGIPGTGGDGTGGDGTGGDGTGGDGTGGDGTGGDGTGGGSPGDGSGDGPEPSPAPSDGGGAGIGDAGPDAATTLTVEDATELAREVFDASDAALVATAYPWNADNLDQDADTGRFGDKADSCSVTVDGRNAALADAPERAIDAPLEGNLSILARSTGELDRYRVDLSIAGASFTAAEGPVLADPAGSRAGFAGTVDVRPYARWGTGLYEVNAATTGTPCEVSTYIRVTGSGVGSVATMVAGLLAIGGLAGLLSALSQVAPTLVLTTQVGAASATTLSAATTQTSTASTATQPSLLSRVGSSIRALFGGSGGTGSGLS